MAGCADVDSTRIGGRTLSLRPEEALSTWQSARSPASDVLSAACSPPRRFEVELVTWGDRGRDAGDEALHLFLLSRERRTAAARRIQHGWRGRRLPHVSPSASSGTVCQPCAPANSIVASWDHRRARRLGALEAHVRFLQFAYRACVRLSPGCWRPGRRRHPKMASKNFTKPKENQYFRVLRLLESLLDRLGAMLGYLEAMRWLYWAILGSS